MSGLNDKTTTESLAADRCTSFLTASADGFNYHVRILSDAPPFLRDDRSEQASLRYSPIYRAYLFAEQSSQSLPLINSSVSLLYTCSTSFALARIKPDLTSKELSLLYFSLGLASIVCIDIPHSRARELALATDSVAFEHWHVNQGIIRPDDILRETLRSATPVQLSFEPRSSGHEEIAIYLEQIYASMDTLWHFYAQFNTTEHRTLKQLTAVVESLVERYHVLCAAPPSGTTGRDPLKPSKEKNSIISAFVELAAALSYAVTQGTTGRPGVLCSPSPFPHHSLLGVGGAVRALTAFCRYLEDALSRRNVADVIERGYSGDFISVPARISTYVSGENYKVLPINDRDSETTEAFDRGGDFANDDHVPLLTHYSLRHGFKESKFSVTAASEALCAEHLPQWTLMTLSHEIMHSRVRELFDALFGIEWSSNDDVVIREEDYLGFKNWYESPEPSGRIPLNCGLKYAILNFCLALERLTACNAELIDDDSLDIEDLSELLYVFGQHKLLAIELFVHFHDYYFVYARQAKLYALSLWASWIRVAAPLVRPKEYLVRSLATLGCGSGHKPRQAYASSCETIIDALDKLESQGVESPLLIRPLFI